MKILLISANTETINMPTLPMGLGLVAAAAEKAGHEVHFLDLMAAGEKALAAVLAEVSPEVIGVSIRNIDDQNSGAPKFLLEKARAVIAECKQLCSAPVVVGGAGYSIFPESALHYLGADMGIQGEGEAVFLELLEKLEAGADVAAVPGLYLPGKGCTTPRSYLQELDEWPFPDPAIFAARFADSSFYLPFQTRRGCPMRCSYCSTATIEGAKIRMRSPQKVVEELRRWHRAGCRQVYFVDNTFNLPPRYAQELCEQLIAAELDLIWRAIFYPSRTAKTLIDAMARAGCREVSMGFESGSSNVLAGMGKNFTTDDIRESAGLLGDAGIVRMGFLMLGGPDETKDSVLESLRFIDGLRLEKVKLTIGIRIYPYTRLAELARKEGVVGVGDDLLRPRFYLKPELADWLRATVAEWAADRPNWLL